MNAEIEALRARLMALEAGLAVATGGPVLQAIAGEAIALSGAIVPGIPPEDDWAVSRDGPIGSIIGPTSGLFAIFEGPVATSVRVVSGDRILHVASGDPTGPDSSLLTGGLESILDRGRAGMTDASPDEFSRRYIGAMRVSLVDGTEVIAHEVIDEFGVGRPIAEVAIDELTERVEQGTARAAEAAQDPGETDSSTVGLPGEDDAMGSRLPTPGGRGGAGGISAAAGGVTAAAAAAAVRHLMRASSRRAESSTDAHEDERSSGGRSDGQPASVEPPSEGLVQCVFCATELTPDDRFCRGCGRSGGEARGTAWVPTHVVPAGGLYAFERPDPSLSPSTTLEAGLPLQVRQTRGAWSEVVASNGWTAWVDGRFLEPAP